MEFSQDDTVFVDTKIVATPITDKKKLLSQQICILKEWTLTSISVQIHVILRQLAGFRFEKKYFAKIVTSLVRVLLKMTLYICISFVFTKIPLF